MTRRTSAWVVCAALVAAAMQVAAAPTAMAAGTPPAMSGFGGPTQPVDLEQTDGAWFTMHLTDDAGIASDPQPDGDNLEVASYVGIRDPAAPNGRYIVYGSLVSGTSTDGDWKFGPFGTAKPYGHWEAFQVHLASVDGDMTNYTVSLVFDVIGRFGAFYTNTPSSGTTTTLHYGWPLTITGRLRWYGDGGHSLPGVTVTFWQKNATTPTFPDGDEIQLGTTTTRSDGTFSFTFTPQRNAFRIYMVAPKGTTSDNVRYSDSIGWTGPVRSLFNINVWPMGGTVPAGTIQYVRGNVTPPHAGQFVYLQRYTRTGWRTVGSARIRTSGRWTLIAQPPTVGNHLYRVYKASDSDHCGFKTRAFTIVGT